MTATIEQLREAVQGELAGLRRQLGNTEGLPDIQRPRDYQARITSMEAALAVDSYGELTAVLQTELNYVRAAARSHAGERGKIAPLTPQIAMVYLTRITKLEDLLGDPASEKSKVLVR